MIQNMLMFIQVLVGGMIHMWKLVSAGEMIKKKEVFSI